MIYELYKIIGNADILTGWFYIFLIPCVIAYWCLPRIRRRLLIFIGITMYLLSGLLSLSIVLYICVVSWITVRRLSTNKSDNSSINKAIGIIMILAPFLLFKTISTMVYNFGFTEIGTKWLSVMGVSYVTLMAVSVIVDYDKNTFNSKYNHSINFGDLVLYLTFFPLATCGPIERPNKMIGQLSKLDSLCFDFNELLIGITMIVYGLFSKLVIADRLGVVTDEVFDNYILYLGYEIIFALIIYGVQLYIDFMACISIVKGIGKCFGIFLSENFRQPYFSQSILDFWNRWHITLSTWLRDYVYIPLGGNRKGRFRTYVNIMVTFLVSGIWHGLTFNYMIWGMIHGLYQIAGRLFKNSHFKGENTICMKAIRIIGTFILVDFAWLFFRVDIKAVPHILKYMVKGLDISFFIANGYLNLGLNQTDWNIVFLGIIIVLVIDLIKNRYGNVVRSYYEREYVIFKYMIIAVFLFSTVILGRYGYEYNSSTFIYRGF